jgi:hypothetical protein
MRLTSAPLWGALCVCLAAAVLPARAHAQPPREGRLEIGGSLGFAGTHDLGSLNATETGNGVPGGSPVTLFTTTTAIERGPLFEGRVAWHLTRALAVEGTFGVIPTHLRTSITNDFEQASPTTATSTLTQYTAEAGVVWHLDGLRFGHGRVRPFVTGGGGYLRQLHDSGTLVETGKSAYAGGGVKIALHEAARGKSSHLEAIGVRADVAAHFTHGGFDLDRNAWRAYPTLTGGAFVCF